MRDIEWRTYGVTDITPFSVILIVLSIIAILLVNKKYFIPCLLIPVFLIAESQRIVVAGFDFNAFRILIVAGWARIVLKNEFSLSKFNAIDYTMVAFVFITMAAYTIQRGDSSGFTYQLGNAYSILGLYFLVRNSVKSLAEVNIIVKSLVVITVILAVVMTVERAMNFNYFSYLGAGPIPVMREGRVRCHGTFGHAILAGTFGASLFPIFASLWWQRKKTRLFAIIGMASSIIIAINSASSGPILTLAAAIGGLCFWPMRKNMRIFFWLVVFGIGLLDLVMKDRVWFVISKMAIVGGSTAWHRSYLIDRAIAHFNEWWLLGTQSTAHWGWGLQDTTNEFIRVAVDGGVFSLILFIMIIALGFKGIGHLIKNLQPAPFPIKILIWSFGVSLFSHLVSFMSVSYWDQIIVLWILLLALVSLIKDFSDKLILQNR